MSLLSDIGTAIKNKLGGTSVDNTVPRYDGTTCKLQGSGVTISDTNAVTASGGFVGNLTGNASTATKLQTARTINGISFDGSANISINAVDSTARIASSEKGVANGVATLDASGLVPSTQLPSYVDDVLEFATLSVFPTTGVIGKIYVDLATNKTYRWSGTAYIYITSGAVDSVAGKTGVVSLVKADVGLGNVDNTSDLNKPISTATQTALNGKQDTLVSGTNIKTINSNSILGDGNVEVQPTLVSGTNIKTVNSVSLLGSGNISTSTFGTNYVNAGKAANGTVYQNNTNIYRVIYISYNDISYIHVSSDNVNWVNVATGSSDNSTITVIIPPNNYYRAAGNIYQWVELI